MLFPLGSGVHALSVEVESIPTFCLQSQTGCACTSVHVNLHLLPPVHRKSRPGRRTSPRPRPGFKCRAPLRPPVGEINPRSLPGNNEPHARSKPAKPTKSLKPGKDEHQEGSEEGRRKEGRKEGGVKTNYRPRIETRLLLKTRVEAKRTETLERRGAGGKGNKVCRQ